MLFYDQLPRTIGLTVHKISKGVSNGIGLNAFTTLAAPSSARLLVLNVAHKSQTHKKANKQSAERVLMNGIKAKDLKGSCSFTYVGGLMCLCMCVCVIFINRTNHIRQLSTLPMQFQHTHTGLQFTSLD